MAFPLIDKFLHFAITYCNKKCRKWRARRRREKKRVEITQGDVGKRTLGGS